MSEEGLGILRVKWPSVNAPARGPAQHHRYRRSPAKMRLGQQVNDLVEGASDEVHKLKLGHRTHSGEGRAEAGVHDGHLGDRSIDHAFGSKAVDEAVGDLESAAVNADVFSDAKDDGIALHLFPDALADCLEVGNGCHVGSKQLRLTIVSGDSSYLGTGCADGGVDLSPAGCVVEGVFGAGFFAGSGAGLASPPSKGVGRKRSSSGSHVQTR